MRIARVLERFWGMAALLPAIAEEHEVTCTSESRAVVTVVVDSMAVSRRQGLQRGRAAIELEPEEKRLRVRLVVSARGPCAFGVPAAHSAVRHACDRDRGALLIALRVKGVLVETILRRVEQEGHRRLVAEHGLERGEQVGFRAEKTSDRWCRRSRLPPHLLAHTAVGSVGCAVGLGDAPALTFLGLLSARKSAARRNCQSSEVFL